MVNCIKAEAKGTHIAKKVSGLFLLRVFADEGITPPEGNNQGESGKPPEDPQFNFEQLIAKARKEEKDKLYPRLKKAEDELRAMTDLNNANLLKVAKLQTEIEELKATDKGAETIKQLQDQISALTVQLEEAKKSAPDEDSIREKLRGEFEVKMYAQEQLASKKDSILSIFRDEVTGTTKEEIDQAIQKAIKKTEDAKKELAGQEGDQTPPPGRNLPNRRTPPVVAPQRKSGGLEIDLDYIRSLDPSSKEYAELRRKLGLR